MTDDASKPEDAVHFTYPASYFCRPGRRYGRDLVVLTAYDEPCGVLPV